MNENIRKGNSVLLFLLMFLRPPRLIGYGATKRSVSNIICVLVCVQLQPLYISFRMKILQYLCRIYIIFVPVMATAFWVWSTMEMWQTSRQWLSTHFFIRPYTYFHSSSKYSILVSYWTLCKKICFWHTLSLIFNQYFCFQENSVEAYEEENYRPKDILANLTIGWSHNKKII